MITQIKKDGLYRLSQYEECVGLQNNLRVKDGSLIAEIGKISLALPLKMEEKIRPHIGKRISVLRTDIPDKEYLIRVVSNEEMDRQGR